jgi:exodeoxyribonuclease X
LKCSLRAWPDAPAHGNQVLRYHHKFDAYEGFDRALASRAHRAEPDAYVTAYLVHKLLSVHGIDVLQAWTKEPKSYPTIGFGKHRGSKWADVLDDYLEWMLKQTGMDPNAVHCAKLELGRRSKQN